MSTSRTSNAVVLGTEEDSKADLLMRMLDKINKKTKDLTDSLVKQGVLTADQIPDIKGIRLAGNKSMKKRVKKLLTTSDDLA